MLEARGFDLTEIINTYLYFTLRCHSSMLGITALLVQVGMKGEKMEGEKEVWG